MTFWISILALTPSYNIFILPTGFLKRNIPSASSIVPRNLFKMPESISDAKSTEGVANMALCVHPLNLVVFVLDSKYDHRLLDLTKQSD